MKQKQQEELEQEIDDLTNFVFTDHMQGEKEIVKLTQENGELKDIITLQAEFIGEHHQSHEFIEWMKEKRDESKEG